MRVLFRLMALLSLAIVLMACGGGGGGGTPQLISEGSGGCSGMTCRASMIRLNGEDFISVNLDWINRDETETLPVEIEFSVETGTVEISFPNSTGDTVTVNLSAGGTQTMRETINGQSVQFRFVASGGLIENAQAVVRRVTD